MLLDQELKLGVPFTHQTAPQEISVKQPRAQTAYKTRVESGILYTVPLVDFMRKGESKTKLHFLNVIC